jgi:ribosome-dependent ATPase
MADLEIRDITVRYKKKVAVHDISFDVNGGEIIGFIGADGAGKSSLMHAISGVIRFEGSVTYQGISFSSVKQAKSVKKHIGLMPQGIGLVLYESLSVMEHLNFFADLYDVKKDQAFLKYREKLLHMSGLSDFTQRRAGNLSGGMMQKLSLICTLLHRPKLLILDEPTTGVDPLSRLELWGILNSIKKEQNAIILVSTAYMQEAAKMDRIILFDDGEMIASGTANELIDSIRQYTYAQVPSDDRSLITFNGFTYSLKRLESPSATPTLEGLFFVNALVKNRPLPLVEIDEREEKLEIPDVILQAKGITKYFGDFIANDKIDIELKKGEIVGLFGANGAGKTTFIKMLLGLYKIDEGELMLLGRSIKSGQDRQELKAKIGYVSQHFALYNDMSVKENLLYFAHMHQISTKSALARIKRFAYELGFETYLNEMPTSLPLGVNQRFSIAAALLHEPIVLFLDEPTSGVDTIARAQFWEILHLLKKRWNITILITTHYMSEAEHCDRAVLLKNGKKVEDDTIADLYKKYPNATTFEDIFSSYYRDEL